MKETLKKIVIITLVCAMCLGLCACGSSGTYSKTAENSPDSGKTAAETASATTAPAAATDISATAAPEFMYKATYTDVTGDEDVSYYTPAYYFPDGSGFYATGYVITGSHAPEGVEPQYYGQFNDTEPAIFKVTFDGKLEILPDYVPLETPEAEEGMYEYAASSYLGGIGVKPDGTLVVTETMYRNWNDLDDPDLSGDEFYEHYHFTTTNYIRYLDANGKELTCCTVDVPNDVYMYSSGTTDPEGNILFTKSTDSGEYSVAAFNETGEEIYEISCDNVPNNIIATADGTVYISIWGDSSMELYRLDFEKKALGSYSELPQDAYNVKIGGGDYSIYYNSGSGLYGLNPVVKEKTESEDTSTVSEATSEPVKVLSWMDCDISSDEAWSFHVDANGSVYVMLDNYESYTMTYDRKIAKLDKVPYTSDSGKTELILASQSIDYETNNLIATFNRSNDSVRIVVKDYSEYNTDEDYSAGLTKLKTEIMAGNCPDIIDMNGLDASQLMSKGLIEDLYTYLDADTELNREDYLTNVLKAAEVEGKLAHTVSWFSFKTVAGMTDIVGDEMGWSYDDLNAALMDMPEGCTPFDVTTTRSEILNTCLNLDMADYVDWSTGEVNFETDSFKKLLEFVNQFPESYNWETYDWTTDSAEAKIGEGMQMLYRTNIYSVDELSYIEACFNGAPLTFVGYPSAGGSGGSGSTINADPGFAMSSSCSDKEAAWTFLRQMFTEKHYANNVSYVGLPVIKSRLEKQLSKACSTTYELDEKGQYKLDANGEKIPELHYYTMDNGIYSYYALSQDIADSFLAAVEATDKSETYDESIKDIVTKQAAAYFSGQKSVDEVVRLIQSNAKIYVNEQR